MDIKGNIKGTIHIKRHHQCVRWWIWTNHYFSLLLSTWLIWMEVMWQQSLKKTAQDSRRLRCPNKELVTGIFRLNYVINGHARIFHLSFLTPAALFRERYLKDSLTSSAFSTSYFLNTSVFSFSCTILHSSLDSVIIMIPTGNNSRETSRIKTQRLNGKNIPFPWWIGWL